jgi:hypothetical protein
VSTPDPNRFSAALITGASSGIGAALATLLPAPARLLLSGRDHAALERVRAGLPEPARVELVVADLARAADRDAVIAAGEAAGIDLLINNAGLGAFGRVVEIDPAREQEMAEVNVVAPVVLTRALLPGMLARAQASGRRGGIIIVSSVVGFAPMPRLATYAATKAFDLHYAEALATELARQPIDVLALCPGATETAFHARAGLPETSLVVHTAEQVAREALDALGRRSVHVVGSLNRATALSLRLLPRLLTRAGTAHATTRIARKRQP